MINSLPELYEYTLSYYIETDYGPLNINYYQTYAHTASEARKKCADYWKIPKSHVLKAERGAKVIL